MVPRRRSVHGLLDLGRPALKQARATTRSLRIWSAASSTGQEAYSLAISLQDSLIAEGWRAEIIGTDLSNEVLEKAKAGRYSQLEMNRGLPAPMLVRHFTRVGTQWQVNDDIKRMVRFQQLNLTSSYAALGQFDVVFLRNVLIYFDLETKRDILSRVRKVLKPGDTCSSGVQKRRWASMRTGTANSSDGFRSTVPRTEVRHEGSGRG